MHKSKNQLYEQIKDLKTKKEFEKEINKRKKETDGLIDDDTLALLIVDELGRNTQNLCKISDLEDKMECTLYGKVTKIGQIRNFNRKNGTDGRVINLELTDDTGTCNLAFWDKDVDLINNKKIKKGTNLKIINSYVKEGYKGLEINVGRYSSIEIDPESIPEKIEKIENKTNDKIRGTIVDKELTRSFFKDNGEIGFVTNIKLRNEKGIQQITIWDEKVKEIQKYKPGDTLDIVNIDIRQKNEITEIHLNGRAVIKKR